MLTQLHDALLVHLAWWGLRRFDSDATYFQWQRERLSPADLALFNERVERKRAPGAGAEEEKAFYDLSARPHVVPVLYSQRYDYYVEVGPRVASRIGDARSVLDFGCGIGILTTFYARQFPDRAFLGIDRSPASIELARRQAAALSLDNVRFECADVEQSPPAGTFDLIIATHALVQAEQDPGLPSQSWRTFERPRDPRLQSEFEQRTGVGRRLDRLTAALVPNGRMIVFEKTRTLARRIPFQRALAARGLGLIEPPELIRYFLVEEIADDGPFYVLGKGMPRGLDWDESPEPDEGLPFDRTKRKPGSADPHAPLYENHWPSAQLVWEQLQHKHLFKEVTRQEPDGRQLHVELGTAESYSYLYCANTFDQRQIVIVESQRPELVETYYREIVSGMETGQV
ncbi:MAG: methyltransferase domain-containing protein [Nitrospirota bacterium]